MTTDAPTQSQVETPQRTASAEKVLGLAVLGCLIAGAIGILKAFAAVSGLDVFLCLLGSVAAFGLVFYIYLGKR